MRRIVFRDPTGQQGSITDELTVNYQGQWEGEIKECLEEIAEEHASEKVYDHIVIELPEKAPVYSVERVDINPRDEGR